MWKDVKAHFLKVIHIRDGTETIVKAILEKSYTPLTTITGFGSDGANVMVGCTSGVATRLHLQLLLH